MASKQITRTVFRLAVSYILVI